MRLNPMAQELSTPTSLPSPPPAAALVGAARLVKCTPVLLTWSQGGGYA